MRPVVVVNPRTDATFVAFVHEQVDGLREVDPLALQAQLRERHPAATVHARLLSSEPSIVWYVYRDGRWVPADENVTSERQEEDGAGIER